MGKLFTTGWSRKPRDKDGKIVVERAKVEGINAVTGEVIGAGKVQEGKMEVVTKTKVAGEEGKATATADLAKMKTETDAPVAAATEEAKKEVKG
ncbi:mannosyl-oligosaccharide alpha-1,2-mannosidase [Oleoguttula sp. CCFEE 5521]